MLNLIFLSPRGLLIILLPEHGCGLVGLLLLWNERCKPGGMLGQCSAVLFLLLGVHLSKLKTTWNECSEGIFFVNTLCVSQWLTSQCNWARFCFTGTRNGPEPWERPRSWGLVDAGSICHCPALPCDVMAREGRKLGRRTRARQGFRLNKILLGSKKRLCEVVWPKIIAPHRLVVIEGTRFASLQVFLVWEESLPLDGIVHGKHICSGRLFSPQ